MSSSPNWTTLEVLNGITVQVVESVEPWTLDIDTLVVAVGPGGFGSLGRAVSQQLSTTFADIPFKQVTPENPYWYPLTYQDRSDAPARLRSIVLATAHDSQGRAAVTLSSRPTIEAAATGLVNALRLADQHGSTWAGATLLGTGRLRLGTNEVAAATVPRVRKLIEDG
ncbi:hypothetical protein, partial [Jatrophihabitans sp.]|uniref:hypothetical protein n=1 Tax=Jatrophihabitans sp. TaxID=1932789 RepID=UPI002EE35263